MGLQGGDVERNAIGGRKKKLLAGVRFSLVVNAGSYDCSKCNARTKNIRNCKNHKEELWTIASGADEWRQVLPGKKEVLKVDATKFFACPISAITPHTWEMLRLGNSCLSGEGDEITLLPFAGGYLEQPQWFRDAMEIIRSERARHRKEQLDKLKKSK